jgi:predicted nucleotide-binding protein
VPYHVRLSVRGQKSYLNDEVKVDLDEATLERQFLRPYREGSSITVNERTVSAGDVGRLRISYSDGSSADLIALLQEADRSSTVQHIGVGGRPSYKWRAAAKARDVTDEFIQGPPGTLTQQDATPAPSRITDPRSVFLINGRWHDAVEAMREFLGALDLKVIEWEQAVQATGKASPYIGEVLDAGFAMAHAAVVLMTPDDVACLHPQLLPSGSEPEPLTGQPRPNVIFEAGMAWQQFRDRTLLVEFGHLRGFSDLDGVHTVRLDGSPQSRRAVASRLKTIECAVDDSGDRWLSAGRFPPSLSQPTAAEMGFEVTEVEMRGTVEPADALRGIPLRWVLLARLAAMHREQASSAHVLDLDVAGVAAQAGVEVTAVQAVLAELISEGLVEGFAESFGHTAIDGACRITGAGLRRLRAEA